MARVDLHLHTCYSPDSLTRLEVVAARCRQAGLTHVCVTDHNTIEGAQAMKEVTDLPVIPGEEIGTRDGEIIGLYLKERIEPGRSAQETIEAIKAQGGLVYIPHPADPLRRALPPETLEGLRDQVDVIEVFNARCLRSSSNREALALAERLGSLRAAASDAHTAAEIGRSYVECADFHSAAQLRAALSRARLHSQRSSARVHLWSRYAAVRHRFRARGTGTRAGE